MTDRRTWITIETERMLVIARRHAVRGWCERCGTEIEFLPSDQVRRRLDTTSGRVLEKHRNNLHRWLAKDGLFCKTVYEIAGGGDFFSPPPADAPLFVEVRA